MNLITVSLIAGCSDILHISGRKFACQWQKLWQILGRNCENGEVCPPFSVINREA
jgi:hypothetical protein